MFLDYKFFDRAKKKIIVETSLAYIVDFTDFSSFIFIEEEDNPSEKVVIVEGEVNSINVDDTGNLEDLLRLVFIDEES